MKTMSKFQLIILLVFGVAIVIGLILFSVNRSASEGVVRVEVWGTMTKRAFTGYYNSSPIAADDKVVVDYREFRTNNLDEELLQALAENRGPDVFFLPHDRILTHRNKVFVVPYANFTERDFKNAFVEGAEIYLTDGGIMGFPFSVDPLVMYWNRDIYTNSGISTPPQYWDQFIDLAPKMTKKTGTLDIKQSAVSLGEFQNITYAKETISSLIMQGGNPITRNLSGGKITLTLNDRFGRSVSPAFASLNFYTQFRDPNKTVYTWNRSLPTSEQLFISNRLATYFAPGSSYGVLKRQNPNLNFDIAPLPQTRGSRDLIVSGDFNAFAIVKSSPNAATAFRVVSSLTSRSAIAGLVSQQGVAPIRRDLLSGVPSDAVSPIIYGGALQAHNWIDPDPEMTDKILKELIESITGGRVGISEALRDASTELQNIADRK